MKIDIITLHPGMFGPLETSIIGRAREKGLVDISVINLRDYGLGNYRQVDDTPYGGGAGMVLRADVIAAAVENIQQEGSHIVLLDPIGKPFHQTRAREMTELNHIIFICGHYEGVDARIRETIADEMISIGDFVLTGGELPTMSIIDAVVRLLPGVLGNNESLRYESFNDGLLEAPVYTRPAEFNGLQVPSVLLSGHHKNITDYRAEQALEITKRHRPDLLKKS